MSKAPPRPDGHPPQATWPPRVPFNSAPITYSDGAVVSKPSVTSGTGGVRIGVTAMSGDLPRTDGTSEMPTEGPGVARRAIPAPEDAVTGTIPPPEPLTVGDDVRHASPTTTHDAPQPAARAARAPRTPRKKAK